MLEILVHRNEKMAFNPEQEAVTHLQGPVNKKGQCPCMTHSVLQQQKKLAIIIPTISKAVSADNPSDNSGTYLIQELCPVSFVV